MHEGFDMRTLKLTGEAQPVRMAFEIERGIDFRPDLEDIARSLARELISNGYVIAHEPSRRPDRDTKIFRFSVYCHRKVVDLP